MKKVLSFLFVIIIIGSCKKGQQKTFDISAYPQKWELVRMSSSIPNSETTGSKMTWQESYLFKTDSTFTKTRVSSKGKETVTGTFSRTNQKEEKYLILTFSSNNNLISSCYLGELKEILFIKQADQLSNTWQACDGPGLEYQRIE